jgi:hypothetical protein
MELISLERPERSFFWTAPVTDTGEMTTEDPLGLDYVAQQVGLLMLPTFTTRSTRAQAYAMVLYGLALAEKAVERFGYPDTEETKRALFERWERFWALATLEYRTGNLPRGDWDNMRGVRGAKAAWKAGNGPLPLDFPLISRQQELGHLGAYLGPLRRSGLVEEGTLKPTLVAYDEIIGNFWDEQGDNKHVSRYEEFAFAALDLSRTKLERKHGNLTLARVGERSRLLSLEDLKRRPQQDRLFSLLFERATDPHTYPLAKLVIAAVEAGTDSPRDILSGAIDGKIGALSDELRNLLVTARCFGDYMQELVRGFDRVYTAITRSGWIVASEDVASAAFPSIVLQSLHLAARQLLDSPFVVAIRRFPMHGSACLRLATDLLDADASTTLKRLLAYHAGVQRERRRGVSWIREESGKLMLDVTSYTAHPDSARFPSFKLDAVRTLLTDMGRLPFSGNLTATEVAS